MGLRYGILIAFYNNIFFIINETRLDLIKLREK